MWQSKHILACCAVCLVCTFAFQTGRNIPSAHGPAAISTTNDFLTLRGRFLTELKAEKNSGKTKKVRRKRKNAPTPSSASVPKSGTTEDSESSATGLDADLISKFDTDWSDFGGVEDEAKEKLVLPSDPYREIKEGSYKSALPGIQDDGPTKAKKQAAKSAAELYEEPPLLKGVKAGTWLAIISLVALEIFVQSPLFKRADVKEPMAPPAASWSRTTAGGSQEEGGRQ